MTATLDAPPLTPELTARLSDHERRCLRRAFDYLALADPDTPGFHYALWVGFGDGWQAYRDSLIRAGFIALRKRTNQIERTPLAHDFVLALSAQAA